MVLGGFRRWGWLFIYLINKIYGVFICLGVVLGIGDILVGKIDLAGKT